MKNKALSLLLFAALSGTSFAQEALIFSGGWNGHKPHQAARYMKTELEKHGFAVTSVKSMDCLNDAESLKKYDLIIPNWTMGKITPVQLKNLSEALKAGVGLAGIHGGMGDAFRKTPEYEAMVGGQFVKHPHIGEYTVDVRVADHPVMEDVSASFVYDSEQYFMRVSDDITVLADADYSTVKPGLRMPVVWVKGWGKGRVFYSALGHNVPLEYEQFPAAAQIFIKGCLWAARDSVE
jgi:type 1 glutamine amidotransferase